MTIFPNIRQVRIENCKNRLFLGQGRINLKHFPVNWDTSEVLKGSGWLELKTQDCPSKNGSKISLDF